MELKQLQVVEGLRLKLFKYGWQALDNVCYKNEMQGKVESCSKKKKKEEEKPPPQPLLRACY